MGGEVATVKAALCATLEASRDQLQRMLPLSDLKVCESESKIESSQLNVIHD